MREGRKLLLTIVIDNFSEYIQIAKSRRPTYYIQNKCRIPKKYMDDERYVYNNKGQLIDLENGGVTVVKNSRSAGTPRYKKINGQDIYNGNISRQARASLVRNIHNYFVPFLQDINLDIDIDNYPLCMELVFRVHDKGKFNIDNDNKWIWRKCIQDTISELKIWDDDNLNIINRNEEETILIPDDEDQKLIINFYGRG